MKMNWSVSYVCSDYWLARVQFHIEMGCHPVKMGLIISIFDITQCALPIVLSQAFQITEGRL